MRRRWFYPLPLLASIALSTAAAAAADPLTVVWDDAHDFDGDELSTNYSQFAAVVAGAGHALTEHNGVAGSLTPAVLTGVDVLMIFDAELAFTAAEVTTVAAFVAGGGRVFVTGETVTAFNHLSHNVLLGGIGSGLSFTSDVSVQDLMNVAGDHPLTAGMSGVDFFAGGALALSGTGTKPLGYDFAGRVGYAYGLDGAVVVLADSNALDNTTMDSSPLALGANETLLVQNLLGHFAGPAGPPPPIEITIDIRPGDSTNAVNPKSKGKVEVALLTTSVEAGDALDFDPWDSVDVESLRFGPGEASIEGVQGEAVDVDADGDLDMLVQFQTQAIGVECDMNALTLGGATFDGDTVVGTDAIMTPGCK